MIQIKGNFAIAYAASKGLSLNQGRGPWGEARFELSPAEVDDVEGPARDAIWLAVGARDFAHFAADEALDNLVSIGDAEILPLCYGPEGPTQVEIVYLTDHEYAVRDRPEGTIGSWEIVRGRDQLMERLIALLYHAGRHVAA